MSELTVLARELPQEFWPIAEQYEVRAAYCGLDTDDVKPRHEWFRPVLERIQMIGELQENWDSYGGCPVNPRCAAAAMSLLLSLLKPETPIPIIVPTNRGGLQIEWHCGGIDLEIEVQSPSHFCVAFEDQQTGEEWEKTLGTDIQPLAPLLARLASNTHKDR